MTSEGWNVLEEIKPQDYQRVWTWNGSRVMDFWWEGGLTYGPLLSWDPVLHDEGITHWMTASTDEDQYLDEDEKLPEPPAQAIQSGMNTGLA
jgi:hypothetical protein